MVWSASSWTCTTVSTGVPTGRNRHGGCIYRSRTDESDYRALQRWRTKSSIPKPLGIGLGYLAFVIATMNMILHGIDAPNIIHTNMLAENLADIQEKDRFDVILANPAFGGNERKEVQQNFPIKTGETAFLFLRHFIKRLKAGASVMSTTTPVPPSGRRPPPRTPSDAPIPPPLF